MNWLDYGNRFIDPRIVRTPSIDIKGYMYPYLSPYQVAGNSPIKFKEIDGNNYGVEVDHGGKTIIVKMDVYVTQSLSLNNLPSNEAMNRAVAAKNFIEGYNDVFNYTFKKEDGTYETYKIQFSVDVKTEQSRTIVQAEALARNDPQGDGNSFSIMPAKKDILLNEKGQPVDARNFDKVRTRSMRGTINNKDVVALHEIIGHGSTSANFGEDGHDPNQGTFLEAGEKSGKGGIGRGVSTDYIKNVLQGGGMAGGLANGDRAPVGNVTGVTPSMRNGSVGINAESVSNKNLSTNGNVVSPK